MQSPPSSGNADDVLPLAARMSRTVIGDALDLLQASYGIADRNMAFAVFRLISQQHNVKLREVATMFVFGQVDAQARTDQALASKKGRQNQEPPVLSFPVRAPRPTEVLQALMRSVQAQTSAIHMTVQASDRLSGGLWIQAQHGFDRPFLDFFGYVDTADASACASALSDAQPVLVDDVEASGIFDEFQSPGHVEGGQSRGGVGTPCRCRGRGVRGGQRALHRGAREHWSAHPACRARRPPLKYRRTGRRKSRPPMPSAALKRC